MLPCFSKSLEKRAMFTEGLKIRYLNPNGKHKLPEMDDSFRTFTQLRGAFTAKRLHKVTACTQQTLPTFFFCEYIVSLLEVIIQGLNLC